jgi:hypothetical protein
MKRRFLWVLVFGSAAILAGSCGGGGWYSDDEGQLVVRVADSPVDDALAIVIQFDAVDAKVSGALNPTYEYSRFKIKPMQQIDMLSLSGGRSQVLIDEDPVSADRWKWIRLVVSAGNQATDSWIDTPTGRYALYLPDENKDGLTIPESFFVPKNGTADLTIELDLRQSIIPPQYPGGVYILAPVLRFVDTDQAGRIEGTVDPGLAASDGCTPVVYGFEGAGVAPDDIDRLVPDPITEGTVALDNASGEFRWSLNWLPAGDYTVALTCQGDMDQADRNDTPAVAFQATKNVSVVAAETTRIDF